MSRFYKFNALANRMVASGQLQAYAPGLHSTGPLTPSTLIFDSTKTKIAKVNDADFARAASTKAGYGAVPKNIKEAQEHFQKDNDLPIHLRGGTADNILYRITMLLCAVGVVGCFHTYYVLSFPKKG